MTIVIKQVGPDVGVFVEGEEKPRGYIRATVLTLEDLRDINGFLSRHVDHLERTPSPRPA